DGKDGDDDNTPNGDEEDCAPGSRSTAEKPYSDTKKRPKYATGQVDSVWENAKDEAGDVYDPNTGERLEWDRSQSRTGQWDMGHKPGLEYRKLHKDYMDGKISKEEFLKEYRDPKAFRD
ncbi:MAG: GH-E family nuclease, partial [Tropicimonas sp.]|uniref:GH-E family nuclease n=1 Tax=Tropicimonas sp. TaxID=2067044 RepID=UPI003A83CC92